MAEAEAKATRGHRLRGGGGQRPATMQEALSPPPPTPPPAPPEATADSVATSQKQRFTRIIAKAKRLAIIENKTIFDIASELQGAIDDFKPIIPKRDWWRQRSDTIGDFERAYRLGMNGRTAQSVRMA